MSEEGGRGEGGHTGHGGGMGVRRCVGGKGGQRRKGVEQSGGRSLSRVGVKSLNQCAHQKSTPYPTS